MDSAHVIRGSRNQRSFDSFSGLIAVFHALHRLLAPRHPPHALSSLAAFIPSSHRVATTPRKRLLPATRPRFRPRVGNDPFLLRAHAETRKKLQRGSLALATSRSCDCNSCRYRIVKEHLPSWDDSRRTFPQPVFPEEGLATVLIHQSLS